MCVKVSSNQISAHEDEDCSKSIANGGQIITSPELANNSPELAVNERAVDCNSTPPEEKAKQQQQQQPGGKKVSLIGPDKGMERPLTVGSVQASYGSCEQTSKNGHETSESEKEKRIKKKSSSNSLDYLKSFPGNPTGQSLGRGLLDTKRSITLSEHLESVQKRHNRPVEPRSISVSSERKSGSNDSSNSNSNSQDHNLDEESGWLQRAAKTIPCLGIMLALCASLFLASAGMLVKMTHSVHGIQVSVFRALIQLIVYGSIIGYRRASVRPKKGEVMAVIARALLGATSITFSYYALRLIPLGDATTIRFSLPIWTLIVSYLVLGEPCSALKIAAVAISICGVVLIARPDDCIYLFHLILSSLNWESEEQFQLNKFNYQNLQAQLQPAHLNPNQEPYQQLTGCSLALASSICLSLSLIALRLCKRTAAEVTIFWLSILSVLIGAMTLISLGEWRMPNNWRDVLFILLNGICGSIGQWFITSALKIEQSGVISLARTFDIEIAFLYSAFFLHEQIRPTSIVGSAMISMGVIAVVVPKWLGSRSGAQVERANFDERQPARSSQDSEYGASNCTQVLAVEQKLPNGRV